MKLARLSFITGALSLSLLSHTALAQQYMFSYSKLYSQIKYNAEPEHPDVKVAFFFAEHKKSNLCRIEKAWMEKEQHYEALSITATQELIVPLDANLRSVNPLVFVDTEQNKQCDFSMVVMAKQALHGQVNYQQIANLMPQMKSLLDQISGMFASWFAPDIVGLTLEFDGIEHGVIQVEQGDDIVIENGKAKVVLADLNSQSRLFLPQKTVRTLPLLDI